MFHLFKDALKAGKTSKYKALHEHCIPVQVPTVQCIPDDRNPTLHKIPCTIFTINT